MHSSKLDEKLQIQEEKTTLEFAKIYLRKIRNNLTLILLVPTILGGLWQLFSLVKIGIPYVRFFSVTQLISDGLLLLIMLPILIIIPFFTYLLGILAVDAIRNMNVKSRFYTITIPIYILSLSLLLYIDTIYLNYVRLVFSTTIDVVFEAFAFIFILPAIMLFISTGNIIDKKISSRLTVKKNNIHTRIKKLLYFLIKRAEFIYVFISSAVIVGSGFVVILIFVRIISSLGDFFIPENLNNISNIGKIIKNQYNLEPEDVEISYLNDTYIFIKHIEIEKDSIAKLKSAHKEEPYNVIILKIDDLFKTE